MNIAAINPFRYRGYYFDTESNFYYLQSRYYDPVVGRFINADDAQILGLGHNAIGYNLFCYCINCPTSYIDVSGNFGFMISIYAISKIALSLLVLIPIIATLLNPDFYRALYDAIVEIGTGIKNLIETVTKAVSNALDKAKFKKRDSRYERHHIVARCSSNPDAAASRRLLGKVNIGINSEYNLVYIKYNLHRHLHTKAYFKSVYQFLKIAEGSYKKTVVVLNVIKRTLQAASSKSS